MSTSAGENSLQMSLAESSCEVTDFENVVEEENENVLDAEDFLKVF